MTKNIIGALLILSGCTFVPYSGNDIYEEHANMPQDEAPHRKNSLEWWYFTGHLFDDTSGKEYGIEYVFFHFNPRNKKDYVMVNFAITDPKENKFYYDYYITPLSDLMEANLPLDFSFTKGVGSYSLSGMTGNYILNADMRNEDIGINLKTISSKPVVLHNSTGYEVYGKYTTAGYYSYPRLKTTGTLNIDGKELQVSGELWYDRQWNCIGVWKKDVSWDWISVQLDDPKSELMVYRLYHAGDDAIIYGGTYFNEKGEFVELGEVDIVMDELAYWKSEKSKINYPVKWNLKVDKLDVDVDIEAVIPNQELTLKFTPIHKMHYWEGMCSVKGMVGNSSVTGDSYIEMTNRKMFDKK